MGTAVMAKKKTPATPEGEQAQPPEPASRVRTGVLMIRGRPEWKEWAEELGEFDRSPSMNELVDRALVVYARHVGFTKTAPRR